MSLKSYVGSLFIDSFKLYINVCLYIIVFMNVNFIVLFCFGVLDGGMIQDSMYELILIFILLYVYKNVMWFIQLKVKFMIFFIFLF